MSKTIKAFFCDIENAGDQFNIDLLKHFGFAPVFSEIHLAEVVSTGSILGWVQSNYMGAIMGPGFMFESSKHPLNRAAVYAVRGMLSRERIFRKNVVLGDPGLLASQIYKVESSNPQYSLGIIPHFYDYDCQAIRKLTAKDPNNILLINIRQKPAEVMKQVGACAAIASSSLHGLIFADALKIPSVWAPLSDKVQGGSFKFKDYYSAFQEELIGLEISQLNSVSEILKHTKCRRADALDEIKHSLNLLYMRLGEIVGEVRETKASRPRQILKIIKNRIQIIESGKYSFFNAADREGIPNFLKWFP